MVVLVVEVVVIEVHQQFLEALETLLVPHHLKEIMVVMEQETGQLMVLLAVEAEHLQLGRLEQPHPLSLETEAQELHQLFLAHLYPTPEAVAVVLMPGLLELEAPVVAAMA